MGFFDKLASLLTRSGRDDSRLLQGMAHADAKRPDKAVGIYDALLDSKGTSATVRARTLFNRALAHSALKDDKKALADLKEVVAMAGAPEGVVTAARTQLARVQHRVERVQNRAQR